MARYVKTAKQRPKLVVMANTLETFGGGERWVLEMASRLGDSIDITIMNPVSKNDVRRVAIGELRKRFTGRYKIVDVPCRSRYVKRGNFLMMFPTTVGLERIRKAIRESDVVYELSVNPLLVATAVSMAKLYRKRMILQMGNPLLLREDKLSELKQSAQARALQRMLFSMIGELQVQTGSQLRMLKRYGYRGKMHYIPHYVYTKPGRGQRRRGGRFRVLFVGRLDVWQKGVDILEKVVESTLAKDKSVVFDLVGSGEGKEILEGSAARHKGNVRYHGFVPEEELIEYYQNADLFILTSRYETPGLALLEAQSYGVPAVAFDVQGPNDIIKHEIQGRLIEPFDIGRFAGAIVSESRRKGAREARRERIRQVIEKMYSTEKFIKSFKKMVSDGHL